MAIDTIVFVNIFFCYNQILAIMISLIVKHNEDGDEDEDGSDLEPDESLSMLGLQPVGILDHLLVAVAAYHGRSRHGLFRCLVGCHVAVGRRHGRVAATPQVIVVAAASPSAAPGRQHVPQVLVTAAGAAAAVPTEGVLQRRLLHLGRNEESRILLALPAPLAAVTAAFLLRSAVAVAPGTSRRLTSPPARVECQAQARIIEPVVGSGQVVGRLPGHSLRWCCGLYVTNGLFVRLKPIKMPRVYLELKGLYSL